jgi:hypothetical protein
MANAYSALRFAPVEWTILPEWYVLVTFPDGEELPINGAFRTKAAALRWIRANSAQWFKEHSERERPAQRRAR